MKINIEAVDREIRDRLIDALTRLRDGDPKAAISLSSGLVRKYPRYAAAHEVLGAALAASGDTQGALASLNEAIRLNPRRATAYTKIGDIYLAQDDSIKARKIFESAIRIEPGERRAHLRLGVLSQRAGQSEIAIQHYEKGLSGAPRDYIGDKVNLGHLYNLSGRHDRTVELLDIPTNGNPRASQLLIVLGDAFHGLK